VRWVAVTEEGLEGGPVMPDIYDGGRQSLEQLRANIERSGEIGQLVAANYRSTIILVPLLAQDTATGKPLNYNKFADALESVRTKYQGPAIKIHITGFAKIVGDLIGSTSIPPTARRQHRHGFTRTSCAMPPAPG
jgi:hypothetical protein